MKKLFVFILAFIYLGEVSGMSLYKHYCMDKLVSWGLTNGGKHCSLCGMVKDLPQKGFCKGCCKDEHKLVKLTDDHKASVSIWIGSLLSEVVPDNSTIETAIPSLTTASSWNSIHAPPLKRKVPFYLFNCVFRI
jgi:hypothetical protein